MRQLIVGACFGCLLPLAGCDLNCEPVECRTNDKKTYQKCDFSVHEEKQVLYRFDSSEVCYCKEGGSDCATKCGAQLLLYCLK